MDSEDWKSISIVLVCALLIGVSIVAVLHRQPNSNQRTYTVYQISIGWAGYVAKATAGNEATFVNGTWNVPLSNCSRNPNSAALVWVGFGGASGDSIEQIGTENQYVNGKPFYSAWHEFWRLENIVPISGFEVRPGDTITASITHPAGTKSFDFYIRDGNQTTAFTMDYGNSSVASADWIVESPFWDNQSRWALADFSPVHFASGFASIGGHLLEITGFGSRPYSDLQHWKDVCAGETLAEAGPVTNYGRDFDVYWVKGDACPRGK